MRIAYLDESGTGKIETEPFSVVAGVIVHADIQWKALEAYLKAMVADRLPGVPDAVFHASDIWHGSGQFNRDRFPDKWQRRMILLELCRLPKLFDLPIFFGHVDRRVFTAQYPQLEPKQSLAVQLSFCALECIACVERYMRLQADSEVAMMIHENNDTSRAYIRETHNFLQKPASRDANVQPELGQYFPVQKIIDTAHFAEKTDTSILQIADALAFALARKLRGADDCDYLFDDIRPNLTILHKSWASDNAAP